MFLMQMSKLKKNKRAIIKLYTRFYYQTPNLNLEIKHTLFL